MTRLFAQHFALDLSWPHRTKGGDGKRLLANDLGAEHGDHCHGDQPKGEKRGRRVAPGGMMLMMMMCLYTITQS